MTQVQDVHVSTHVNAMKAVPTEAAKPTPLLSIHTTKQSSKWSRTVFLALTKKQLFLQKMTARERLPQIFYCSIWVDSLRAQAAVVWNAASSVVCAGLANACFALGNVFSGKASTHQSSKELIVANSIWFALWYCSLLLIAHVPAMRSFHFIDKPDQRPPISFCLNKLFSGSYPYALLTLVLMFGVGTLVANTSLRNYKLDAYLLILCSVVYNIAIGLTFRKTFLRDTIEGRERLIKRGQFQSPSWNTSQQIAPLPSTQKPKNHSPRFGSVYVKALSQQLGLIFIAGYVHIVSRQELAKRGDFVVAWFMVGSFFFKLAIQELVKYYILKSRINDLRAMSVMVGIPTVMIDTQSRIILLGLQNSRSLVAGTIGMAIVEIASRFLKAALMMWEIRQRKKNILRAVAPQRQLVMQSFEASDTLEKVEPLHNSKHIEDFTQWLEKRHAYHTAEIHADMFAEYIAMGCSASVLCLLGRNSHYSRLGFSQEDTTSAQSIVNQLSIAGMQAAIEILVDYVSIALEMAAGIDYARVKDLSSFFAMMFMTIAFLNIILTVMIYMD